MKRRMLVLSAWLMLAVAACNMDSFPPEFEEKPVKRFVASDNEFYGPAEPALKQLLVDESKNSGTNQFCIVGYAYADKIINVWVHWVNGDRLLLWRGSSDPQSREQGLLMAQRDLKLGKDTVETPDQINGSTYLVTRAWWQAVAKDCAAHGQKYEIGPFSGTVQPQG